MDGEGRTASGTAVEEQLPEQLPDARERRSRTYRSPITDHGNTPYIEGLKNENVDSIQRKDFICGF